MQNRWTLQKTYEQLKTHSTHQTRRVPPLGTLPCMARRPPTTTITLIVPARRPVLSESQRSAFVVTVTPNLVSIPYGKQTLETLLVKRICTEIVVRNSALLVGIGSTYTTLTQDNDKGKRQNAIITHEGERRKLQRQPMYAKLLKT